MGDYLASLAAIEARHFTTLWPTHGPPIREVDAFIAAYTAHRHERANQILRALEAGPARIRDLVPRLYADVDSKLWPAASRSMLAAILYLSGEGKIVALDDAGSDSEYRLAD
jgi:glyoxylase-like metal-dependent hydrolase (beta-lactamase superfamily II)